MAVMLFCLCIICSQPIIQEMKRHPGPVVRPPVNETFMSVF